MQSSPSDPLSPEEQDPIKVIAIKLPFDLQERFMAFPFLHALRERYPKSDMHLITPKKHIEILNLLPFKAFYHEFDEDEIQSIFDVHRYCVHAKIYNVDLFISLTNSFADSALGLGLRARQRLGFSDGWKTIVLNEKVTRPAGHHLSEDFFALYKAHVGGEVDTRIKVMSRDLSPIIEDAEGKPYVAINLSPIRDVGLDSEWLKLAQNFEQQKIIFFSSEDQAKLNLMIKPFLAQLPKKNSYDVFEASDWIELAKMLAYSQGVITYNGPAASLAAYVGARTFILYDQEDPQRYGPFYFLADVALLNVNDPGVINKAEVKGSLQPAKTFNMDEVYRRAADFFKI